MKEYAGWAVVGEDGRPRGRFYFSPFPHHPSMNGHRTAVFETRAEARAAAKTCHYPMRVVRAHISITLGATPPRVGARGKEKG